MYEIDVESMTQAKEIPTEILEKYGLTRVRVTWVDNDSHFESTCILQDDIAAQKKR